MFNAKPRGYLSEKNTQSNGWKKQIESSAIDSFPLTEYDKSECEEPCSPKSPVFSSCCSEDIIKPKETVCDSHCLPFKFFCTEDKSFLCENCILYGLHKNHKYNSLSELKSHFYNYSCKKDNLTNELNNLIKERHSVNQLTRDTLKIKRKEIESSAAVFEVEMLERVKTKIRSCSANLFSLIDQLEDLISSNTPLFNRIENSLTNILE